MEVERIPSPTPLFERLGDQAAALLLESLGVVFKIGPAGIQLRNGVRGRLTKPPAESLADAVQDFIEQGPLGMVSAFVPELMACAAMSLSDDPFDEVLAACQDALLDAQVLADARAAPEDDPLPDHRKVISFPRSPT
ncbi:hypothetical protein CMI37_07675 [Candidatus Pacearchaeota archaeon]|nr:hypothetical protein [Candidatus Pacearchaeota archaeon]|tara:strand:+ start:919 stop:1329 length:411 start_codon:yes stop_codon:yes gene_type:complete